MSKGFDIADYLDKGFIACGLVGAEVVSKHLLDCKPVFLYKERVHLHHWMIGAGLSLVGLTTKKSENKAIELIGSCLTGMGIGIFLHDIRDFLRCFKFRAKTS